MSIDQMRCALIEVYPGPNWRKRVIEMEDKQVIATYKNMERKGNLYKHERSERR